MTTTESSVFGGCFPQLFRGIFILCPLNPLRLFQSGINRWSYMGWMPIHFQTLPSPLLQVHKKNGPYHDQRCVQRGYSILNTAEDVVSNYDNCDPDYKKIAQTETETFCRKSMPFDHQKRIDVSLSSLCPPPHSKQNDSLSLRQKGAPTISRCSNSCAGIRNNRTPWHRAHWFYTH